MLGLQNSKECFCGDSHGKHGASDEEECNLTCDGNPEEFCGGHYRNSVYAINEGIVYCLLITINTPYFRQK